MNKLYDELLEHTQQLFKTEGERAFNLSRIARELGKSRSSVSNALLGRGLQGLIDDVLNRVYKEWQPCLEAMIETYSVQETLDVLLQYEKQVQCAVNIIKLPPKKKFQKFREKLLADWEYGVPKHSANLANGNKKVAAQLTEVIPGTFAGIFVANNEGLNYKQQVRQMGKIMDVVLDRGDHES